MSQSETAVLREQFAYNAWANAEVFGVTAGMDREQLEVAAPGTFGTLAETLKHIARVEEAYLHLLRDGTLEGMTDRAAYFDHDLDWFAGRQARLGDDYDDLLARADESFLDGALDVPWFDLPLTRRDGLLQVLSHSAWHRAQVFSSLGAQGLQVPDLDYLFFVKARRAGHVAE